MDSTHPPLSTAPAAEERGALWPWVGVVALTAVGLALSVYLEQEHVLAWTDPNLHSLCDINELYSCTTVARSHWAVFLGVPVALWGVLGYLAMAGVGFWGWFSRGARPAIAAIAVLSLFSTVVSIALGIISKVAVGALCPFCMGTYGVNGALLALSLALLARGGFAATFAAGVEFVRAHLGATVQLGLVGALATGLLIVFYPKYWVGTDAVGGGVVMPAAPSSSACAEGDLATGTTPEGHHWIGAPNPKVTITEYSDYQCPYCALAHRKLRTLIEAHPGVIRVVHRHFPLDHQCNPIIQEPFHPAACYYAALATCAGEQGKFWAANDYLYLHGREPKAIRAEELGSELGLDVARVKECLDKRAWGMMRSDLEEGIKLQIQGTPTFVIDGKVLMGADPAEILAPYLKGSGALRTIPKEADSMASASASPSGSAAAASPPGTAAAPTTGAASPSTTAPAPAPAASP